MDKKEIKNILMSMRTLENEEKVNYMLGRLDLKDEIEIKKMVEQIGETEEKIKEFLEKEVLKKQSIQQDKFIKINEMFTYGINGKTIHLHLPMKLDEKISKIGYKKTKDLVNLYLLDAIDRILKLKQDNYYRFQEAEKIYMISPLLIKPELKFLEELDFKTNWFNKKELKDEEFKKRNPEAMFAIQTFEESMSVGTAKIELTTIATDEWQIKKQNIIEDIERKGISIKDNESKEY